MIFAPICAARGPPWERKGLPVETSGVCEYVEKLVFGKLSIFFCEIVTPAGSGLKLGWFKRLKTSNRSCRLILSVILVVLFRLKSVWTKCGPRKALRPHVPMVPSAGMENIAGTLVMVGLLGSLNW